MEISDIRVKLIQEPNDRLKAVCSITLDDAFVVRDLKVVEGTQGLFVAMPSRKLTVHCPKCRFKNHLRARFCNDCGSKLPPVEVSTEPEGRSRLHRDIAHPINTEFREIVQTKVLERYEAERAAADEAQQTSTETETPEKVERSPVEIETHSDESPASATADDETLAAGRAALGRSSPPDVTRQASAVGENAPDAPSEEPATSSDTAEAATSSDAPSEEPATSSDTTEDATSIDTGDAATSDDDEPEFETSDYDSLIAGLRPGGSRTKRVEEKTDQRPAPASKPQDRKPRRRRDRGRTDTKRDAPQATAKTDDETPEKPVEVAPEAAPPPAPPPPSQPDDEEPAFGAGIL
ncbi:MAG: septation protein SpoVG family protein [Planctomycetes bacterium]|nr:septation protein SpoVG family protein [Planctomycetota bacterium]